MFSNFPCPYGWDGSGGAAAARTVSRMRAEATTSTVDWTPSASTLIEPEAMPAVILIATRTRLDVRERPAAACCRRAGGAGGWGGGARGAGGEGVAGRGGD